MKGWLGQLMGGTGTFRYTRSGGQIDQTRVVHDPAIDPIRIMRLAADYASRNRMDRNYHLIMVRTLGADALRVVKYQEVVTLKDWAEGLALTDDRQSAVGRPWYGKILPGVSFYVVSNTTWRRIQLWTRLQERQREAA